MQWRKLERIAAALYLLTGLGCALLAGRGRLGIYFAVYCLLGMCLIWFPEATIKFNYTVARRRMHPATPPVLVRLLGWFWLLIPAIIIYLAWLLR